MEMPKKRTSINIDEDLWREFQIFVLKYKGSTHKTSETFEEALREFMKNHEKDINS